MAAETRAVAAEIIAQEANAIRFKVLLEAARGQAANRNIRSAEERFAAAKDKWEMVRQGLPPEPDPYAEPADGASPSSAEPASAPIPAVVEPAETSRRNWLMLGGLPAVAILAAVAIAMHFYSAGGAATIAAEQTVHPAAQALAAPTGSEPAIPAAAMDRAAESVSPLDAKSGSKVKVVTRVKPAAARKSKQPVAAPPRARPEPEELAAGERVQAERSWTSRGIE